MHVRVAADACAGLSETDHQRALDAMALFAPLIEITDSSAVLDSIR
jgi:nicotinamidase-related amidase